MIEHGIGCGGGCAHSRDAIHVCLDVSTVHHVSVMCTLFGMHGISAEAFLIIGDYMSLHTSYMYLCPLHSWFTSYCTASLLSQVTHFIIPLAPYRHMAGGKQNILPV